MNYNYLIRNNDDVSINDTIIIEINTVKLVVNCSESIKYLNKYVLFVFSVSNLAQIMIALAIFGSYPIQCYVGLEIIWGNYLVHWIKNCDKDCLVEYALRTSFVVLSCKCMHDLIIVSVAKVMLRQGAKNNVPIH